MSLRITQGIIYSSTLQHIRNATVNGLQTRSQLATGRRVNRPSDDPAGILRIMPLRREIRDLDTTQNSLRLAQHQINNSASVLEAASGTLADLREKTIQAANGTMTHGDRQALADAVDQLLQQMLASANASWNSQFVFAGARADVVPFEIVDDSLGSRIVYHGDQNTNSIQITVGIESEMNLPGDQVFMFRDRKPTTFEGNTGATPSGAADSGVGFGTLDVSFAGLDIPAGTTGIAQGDNSTTALGPLAYTYTAGAPPTLSLNGGPPQAIAGGIQSFAVGSGSETVSLDIAIPISPATGTITSQADLSTDGGSTVVTVDDFSAGTSYQVRNSVDGTVLNVDASGVVRTGDELVKFEGTFDAFTSLIAVRDTLRNERGDPDDDVSQRLDALLADVDFAHDGVLAGLQKLGNRSQHLDLFASRLGELSLARTGSLSEIEDTDVVETILQLEQQDLLFQASMQVGARAIQTTLLNFLR